MAISFSSSVITVTGGIESGTATSGSSTTLAHSGKSWTTNTYANRYVWIHTGSGAGAIGFITSNTSNTLTIGDGFWKTNFTTTALEQVTPDSTSQYVICYNMADVQAAETAAAADWGIITQGTNAYYLTSRLVIGNSSTKTGFCLFGEFLEFGNIGGYLAPELKVTTSAKLCLGRHIRYNRGSTVSFLRSGSNSSEDYVYFQLDGDGDIFGNSIIRGIPVSEDSDSGLPFLANSTAKLTVFGGAAQCVLFDRMGQLRIRTTSVAVDGLKKVGNAQLSIIAAVPRMSRLTVSHAYDALSGSSSVSPSTYTLDAPTFLSNSRSDVWCHGGHTINLINPTWAGLVYVFTTGTVNEQWTYDLNIAGSLNGVRVYCKTAAGTQVLNDVTSGGVLSQQVITARQWVSSASPTSTFGPHEFRVRKYGYFSQTETQTLTAKVVTSKTLLANNYLAVSEATAAAYTGVSINGTAKTITLTSARTLQETHDYAQAWADDSGNIQYDEPLTTTNGADFLMPTGWTIIPSGNLTYSDKRLSGGTLQLDSAGIHSPILGSIGIKLTAAGTYSLGGADITGTVTLTNTSGGNVTVELAAGVPYVNSGPNITVNTPTTTRGITFSGLVAGSFVRVVQNSDGTEKFLVTNSASSETWSEASSGSLAVSYMVMKAGYDPVGPISVTVTGAVSGGILDVPITQIPARWYQTSSGLTINTNAFANATTKKFGLTTASTLQNFASYLLEQWVALGGTGGAFANKPWPISANGPNSFTWLDGWEADLTTYPSTISNLSRDGMRYLNTSGTRTASWCALLSAGVSAGMLVRYQQSDGGTTVDAASTGNIDQLIQIYGDASHGNFDRTGYLVTKVQESGYDQAEVDVVSQYGTLEDQLYVVALAPTANGIATGNPSLANPPSITDHGASPVTWNGGPMSITITDSAAGNSGTGIMRWLRHFFETGGSFQSKDAFNWHDLVQTNGADFKTVRGKIYGDTGATLKGVRVLTNAGAAHPDFSLFTFDDGTTYAPPPSASVTINGLTSGSRVQLYDTLNGTEIYNAVVGSTSLVYSETYSVDRTVRVRITYMSGTTAKEMIEATVGTLTSSAPDISYNASQDNDATYISNAVDGSTVTGITINDSIDRVEIAIAGGTVPWKDIYAYQVYWLNTETGIRDDFAFIESPDPANYILTNFRIKNTSLPSVPLIITGGYGVDSSTGSIKDIMDTSAGSIFPAPDHVVSSVVTVGGTNIITGDIADVPTADEIKAAIVSATETLTVGKFLGLK